MNELAGRVVELRRRYLLLSIPTAQWVRLTSTHWLTQTLYNGGI